jgi:hypothetical protein
MTTMTAVSTIFLLPWFAAQGFPLPQSMQTVSLRIVLVLVVI